METIKSIIAKNKKKDEEPIMLLRRHWFVIFYRLGSVIFMGLVLALVYFSVKAVIPTFGGGNMSAVLDFAESLGLMVIWFVFFITWIDYYFDIWIITTRRVINIEQRALFSRYVSELKFSKIQDVTTEIHGIIPTMLNYGDVYVQTAGEQARFVFRQVPDPNKAKELLLKLQERARKKETDEFGEVIKEKIEESDN